MYILQVCNTEEVYCRGCISGGAFQGVYCKGCITGGVLQGVYCIGCMHGMY